MNQKLRKEANQIIAEVLASVKPDAAVSYLQEQHISYEKGVVVTKYHHVMGALPRITCVEAGHPVPDENSFRGTEEVLSMVQNLTEEDMVLFLVSGGRDMEIKCY